jgi:hypothetical protein
MKFARLAQLAARRSHNPKVASSILAPSKKQKIILNFKKAPLAQLVAHRSYVPRVQGSSP